MRKMANSVRMHATVRRRLSTINRFSSRVTEPKSQGASQAMLRATGLGTEDLKLAQVGISSMWWEGNPCNMHLLDLSNDTIGVSDGISMGTRGMSYSLQSRDIIADSIETVMNAQWYDANISIPGCDKNMPGCLMAMARVDRPSIMVYGGTIKRGCGTHGANAGQPLDIVNAFQAYGEYVVGRIDEPTRDDIIAHACPGAGACGGMYTANTMASAIEAMGMSLPYSSSTPATDKAKLAECRAAGRAIRHLLQNDIRPSDIMTPTSFRNAICLVMATGGSTNAVLHLIAMARAVNRTDLGDVSLDLFQDISDRVPLIADLKPSGRFMMEDLHRVGGVPALLKLLEREGFVDGNCMTVTGKTLSENLASLPDLTEGQEVIVPISTPIKATGHLQVLYGDLAPEGSVAKITGKEGATFAGPARCFDCEEDMLEALEQDPNSFKGSVVVIRYEGPQGGPGMPEMLTPTSAIMGAGLGEDVAMLTDGRFSGGSHGFIIGHITPEAQLGGPIALLHDGDKIVINCGGENGRSINIAGIDANEWASRKIAWVPPETKATKGTLFKYIKNVSSASLGCVTDEATLS
jgi:dihydroxy-acid dehydratase